VTNSFALLLVEPTKLLKLPYEYVKYQACRHWMIIAQVILGSRGDCVCYQTCLVVMLPAAIFLFATGQAAIWQSICTMSTTLRALQPHQGQVSTVAYLKLQVAEHHAPFIRHQALSPPAVHLIKLRLVCLPAWLNLDLLCIGCELSGLAGFWSAVHCKPSTITGSSRSAQLLTPGACASATVACRSVFNMCCAAASDGKFLMPQEFAGRVSLSPGHSCSRSSHTHQQH